MNTTIETLVKQTVAVVLAALITVVIANSISELARTDISGKPFVTAAAYAPDNSYAAG
jgi:ABC-type amino acid transport system permease subunit